METYQQIWNEKEFKSAKRPSLYDVIEECGKTFLIWKHPPKDRNTDGDLIFANVDTTYRLVPIESVPEHCLSEKQRIYQYVIKEVPLIDIYGVTENEHSVTCHVWGAEPYFYVSCKIPEEDTEYSLCRRVQHRLQCLMMDIDPDSSSQEQMEKVDIYASQYSHLIPGEMDMDQNSEEVIIPEGILSESFRIYVMDVSIINARSIYGAHMRDRHFFKITMASPRMITKARRFFQEPKFQRFRNPIYGSAVQTFESNVAFVTRQMCDRRIKGMHWLKAKWSHDTRIGIDVEHFVQKEYPYMLNPPNDDMKEYIHKQTSEAYKEEIMYKNIRNAYGLHKSESTSQIEFDVRIEDIGGIPEDKEYKNKIPPLRIWSFDIEVANSVRGMFPSATNPGDKFITGCGTAYHIGNASNPFDVTAFVLGGIEKHLEVDKKWRVDEKDFHVYSYWSEEELFEGFQAYIRDLDPDVISGFNIFGFDLPYLCNRAKYLKLSPEQWGYAGRSTHRPILMKKCTFQSNAYGRKDFHIPMITGRCYLDVLETIQRDYTCKYRGYTLNNCAKELLGEEKDDIPFWKITSMYMKNGEARKKMVKYCVTDAYLPPKMEEKKGHAILYVEQARLYGVNVTELILRGQQHRLLTYLINCCLDLVIEGEPKLLIPVLSRTTTSDGKRTVQYEGATVIEPERGFYTDPIATIDFTSLYPSIMLAHNLCYSTFIPPNNRRYFSGEHYFVTPSGDAFLYPLVKEGVLCKMLKSLLAARKEAKKMMASATTPIEKAMYNAKQLALKLGANSAYGFTGAGVGSLPCFAVSRSVTAYGREYIHMTKAFVEQLPMLSDTKVYTLSEDTPINDIHNKEGLPDDIPIPWFTTDSDGKSRYTKEYEDLVSDYIDTSESGSTKYKTPYRCIYGDTDSVMVLMPYLGRDDMDESVRVGKLLEHLCNALLYPNPIKMEWEKNYCPYLLLKKKKYIGLLWMDKKVRNVKTGKVYDKAEPLYIDAKGVMSVRRDNAPMEAELVKLIQRVLMGLNSDIKIPHFDLETIPPPWKPNEKPGVVMMKNPMNPDVRLAESIIRERLTSMASGEVDLEQFTITKALSRREEDYKNLQPHVKVNQDIRNRSPGTEYPLGARIPYIIANTRKRTSTMNAQDPLWMAYNGIGPDIKYYRDRLSKPLVQIMAPSMFRKEFRIAVKKNEQVKKFFALDEELDDEEISDEEYHITEVFIENDEDDDLSNAFARLNRNGKQLSMEEMRKRSDKEEKVVTIDSFLLFNKLHNNSEARIIKDTYARLFHTSEKSRKRKGNIVSRAKFDLDKKRKTGKDNSNFNVLDLVTLNMCQNTQFQDEYDENEAFRAYREYRAAICTTNAPYRERQTFQITKKKEKDAFRRGTEIFKEIANPKEGCARLIQYDWGSILEEYNKKKAFSAVDPYGYAQACKEYLSST